MRIPVGLCFCTCLSCFSPNCAEPAEPPPAAGGPAVRIEADCPRIGMGRSVEIRAAATWADGRPAAGCLLLPYVNGRR